MTAGFVPGTVAYNAPSRTRGQIAAWLLFCAALVLAITMLGGITRLTHSGLSIVTWEPIAGVLPPLTEKAWEAEFAHYQQFPEYQIVNRGMNLAGFKSIFWFEYAHRLLARFIGIAYAVPFAFFLLTGRVERSFAWKLFGLLVLGGVQGVLGWLMVASGLVDRPDVSHYRLTAHLGLAVLIFIVMIWLALRVLVPGALGGTGEAAPRRFRRTALGAIGGVYVLVLSGGLVAGLDAGFSYNTFPTMDGQWAPESLFTEHPFESIVGVQFLHRWLGVIVAVFLVFLWGRALDVGLPRGAIWAFHATVLAVAVQGLLGILTLVNAVPVPLAVLHQGVALVVLATVVAAAYLAGMSHLVPRSGMRIIE